MYPGFDEAKLIAVDCVRFFCLSGDEQMTSWRIAKNEFKLPRMLYDESREVVIGDYMRGVFGVFYTYSWVFHEMDISESVLDIFYDFKGRLDVMSCVGESDLSSSAILNDVAWDKLRKDAKLFLNELGELPDVNLPIFDIGSLINPDEFRTSDEVRKLLE